MVFKSKRLEFDVIFNSVKLYNSTLCADSKCLPGQCPIEYLVIWLVIVFSMQNFMDIRVNNFELDVYLIFPTLSDLGSG